MRSAWLQEPMATGTDGEEAFEEGYGKTFEFAVCTREQEAKVDGTEDRVPVGVYRNTSTAEKVTNERIVLARDCGPRREAKGGRAQEKGGRGDTRVCWSCGKTGHIAANCVKGWVGTGV